MGKLIIIIAAIALGFVLWSWLKTNYAKFGRSFAVKAFIVGIAILLITLAAIGRVHWVGAALASLLAVIRFSLPMLIRSLPFLQRFMQNQANSSQGSQQNQNNQYTDTDISIEQAFAILGLEAGASNEEIVTAHRRLIQKLHPDRGGNEFLATQLNLAKDKLLNS